MLLVRQLQNSIAREVSKMNRALTTVGVGIAGAGLMYLLDPKMGRRRRAFLRDKGIRYSKVFGRSVGVAGRDIGHRFQGIAALAIRVFKKRAIVDQVLAHRVRTELGRIVTNPSGIRVEAKNGHVTLSGGIPQPEYSPLLKRIQKVAGVRFINDRLTPRWPIGEQGERTGTITSGFRWLSRGKAIAIGSGLGALLFGAAKRNTLGAVAAAAGASLIATGIAKRSGRGTDTEWQGALDRYAS
jgi:hypothetical protein